MPKRRRWLILCGSLTLAAGCYPTTDDVNNLAEAERQHVGELHTASNELMTDQHSAMTPELADPFSSMFEDAATKIAAAAAKAADTKASGPALGGLMNGENGGLIPWLLGVFNLGWVYTLFKGFGKSRASGDVARVTEDVAKLRLELAESAKSGAKLPSDA